MLFTMIYLGMPWKDFHIINALNVMNHILVVWKIVKQHKMIIRILKRRNSFVENAYQLGERAVQRIVKHMAKNS